VLPVLARNIATSAHLRKPGAVCRVGLEKGYADAGADAALLTMSRSKGSFDALCEAFCNGSCIVDVGHR